MGATVAASQRIPLKRIPPNPRGIPPQPPFIRGEQETEKETAPLDKAGLRENPPQPPFIRGEQETEKGTAPLDKAGLRENPPQPPFIRGGARKQKKKQLLLIRQD